MSLIQNHQVNLLVVDSDPMARTLMQEVMISDGYTCRAVANAAAAIASAKERCPDLLICDMNLEDGTGVDLLKQMRPLSQCPAILLSDSRDADMVRFARNGGATFFLAKPFDIDVLMELVDKALWMPHLVQRHVGASTHRAHQVKAPSFSIQSGVGSPQTS